MQTEGNFFVVGQRIHAYPRTLTLVNAFSSVFSVRATEIINTSVFKQWRFVREVVRLGEIRDTLVVLYPAEHLLWVTVLAKLFFKGRVIVDMFISSYDSIVNDRALAHPKSIKGIYYAFADQLSCFFADVLVFDTPEHEKYFRSRNFIRQKTKTVVIPISLDLEMIQGIKAGYPPSIRERSGDYFILFFGNYIPLQGVDCIMQAFAKLPNRHEYHLVMVGNGQTRPQALRLRDELELVDVEFVPRLSHTEVLALAKKSDLVLGIFGNTEKAKRVIPNKLLEAMACGAPVITGRNSACERYFHDQEDIFYCELGNPEDLARVIVETRTDEKRRREVSARALKIIENEFSLKRLQARVRELA